MRETGNQSEEEVEMEDEWCRRREREERKGGGGGMCDTHVTVGNERGGGEEGTSDRVVVGEVEEGGGAAYVSQRTMRGVHDTSPGYRLAVFLLIGAKIINNFLHRCSAVAALDSSCLHLVNTHAHKPVRMQFLVQVRAKMNSRR